jgi:hypothetical protein
MITSKERFLNAFKHIEGDRIPLFEQSIASSVASKILGRTAYTGSVSLHKEEADAFLLGESYHNEFVEKMRQDVIDIAYKLELDAIRPPWRLIEKPTKKLDDLTYLYGDLNTDYWVIRKYSPTSDTFEVYDSSEYKMDIEGLEKKIEKFEENVRNKNFTKDDFKELIFYIEKCGKEKEVLGGSGISIPLNPPIWLEAIIVRPDLIQRYLDAVVEQEIKSIKIQKELGIKVIWGGGDFADKNGPIYGPKVFKEMLLPRLKKICDFCHSLGLYYVFRSDGKLWTVADDLFLNSGVDGYGEIDVDSGMDLGELKKRYGKKITFWGGVSCGKVLLLGTKQDVIDAVKKAIDDTAKGGGYIFGSSNSIMSGTPIENVLIAFETAKNYGKY